MRFDNGEKDVMYENLAASGITVGGGQGGKDNAVYTIYDNILYTLYYTVKKMNLSAHGNGWTQRYA